jgi:hypothetical protein
MNAAPHQSSRKVSPIHVPSSSNGERSLRLRLNSGKGFGANGKMLIDVLTQQRHCRNVTLRKSYNRATIETGSAIHSDLLERKPKPSPGANPKLCVGAFFCLDAERG